MVETQFGYHIIKMEEREEEDIRVRHILKMIEPTEEDIAQVIQETEDLLVTLKAGADFTENALNFSDDESAANGGIIGEFTAENFPEMFKDHISNLNISEYTDVIREGNNLYIFTKTRIVPERVFTLEEVRDNLRDFLRSQKQIEHFERWIQNLRANSYVEILHSS